MNKKLIFKTKHGKLCYCVLDSAKDLEEQLHEVFGISKGHGLGVDLFSDKIKIADRFHGDALATMPVISLEDTEQDIILEQVEIISGE